MAGVRFSFEGSVDRQAQALIETDRKFRATTLKKIGNDSTKAMLKIMKPLARKNRQTGTLVRSLGRKLQVKNAGTRLFMIVGPRAGYARTIQLRTPVRSRLTTSVAEVRRLESAVAEARKRYRAGGAANYRQLRAELRSASKRLAQGRRRFLARHGLQYRDPIYYAHLAGPGRQQTFVTETVERAQPAVNQIAQEGLRNALEQHAGGNA